MGCHSAGQDAGTGGGGRWVTVNAVLSAGANTDFIHNQAMYQVLRPGLDNPTKQDVMPLFEAAPGAAGAAERLPRDPVPGI
jgi:hypothetical protein